MATMMILGASCLVSSFKGEQSYEDAALVVTPESVPSDTTKDWEAEVLFCLPPVFGQQPFVFNQAVLHVGRERGNDVGATLKDIRFGKAEWNADKKCISNPVNPDLDFDCVASFDPHLGWNTTNTPLAITFLVKWRGILRIMWLELRSC
ncbi:MAG: hypothetical protein M1839_003848 [Geoglossum umbratile]|nr:MAG: hypothetical protein M1839_003848 [Geoglossum umbratile]